MPGPTQAAKTNWATRDMARAALDASTDIPGWSVEALPSGCGILALEAGSLPALPKGGSGQAFGLGEPRRLAGLRAPVGLMPRDIDVSAISWARSGHGVRVAVWGTADAQALTMVRGDAPTILPEVVIWTCGVNPLPADVGACGPQRPSLIRARVAPKRYTARVATARVGRRDLAEEVLKVGGNAARLPCTTRGPKLGRLVGGGTRVHQESHPEPG